MVNDLRSVPDLDKIFIVSAVSLESGEPEDDGYLQLEEVPVSGSRSCRPKAASVKDAGFTIPPLAKMRCTKHYVKDVLMS